MADTVYARAGGSAAMLALARAHHARCLQDPELSHAFLHGRRADHVERLAGYLGEVLGGPAVTDAQLGGQSSVLARHAGEGIGREWGERFVACFVQAADDAGLPQDPQLREALRAYMVWATRDLEQYAPPGSQVPEGLPVPRWSWDGLQA